MHTNNKSTRTRKLLHQKLLGLGLFIISLAFILVNAADVSIADRDATAALLLIPLSLYLLFTRKVYLI